MKTKTDMEIAIALLRRAKRYVHSCYVMMEDKRAKEFKEEIFRFIQQQKTKTP